MEKSFDLSIFLPNRILFEGRVTSLVVPGAAGYFGILSDHAPFVSTLIPGRIEINTDTGAKKHFLNQESGFLRVSHNKCIMLINKCAD